MDPFEIYAIVAAGLFFLVLIVVSFMIRRRSQIRKTERAFVHSILPTTPMSGPEVVVVPREVTPVSRSVYPANDRLPLYYQSSATTLGSATMSTSSLALLNPKPRGFIRIPPPAYTER